MSQAPSRHPWVFSLLLIGTALSACIPKKDPASTGSGNPKPSDESARGERRFKTPPLISTLYTADPSAHVFQDRLYVYPSHDIDAGIRPDDLGSHFAMRDYHVLSMDAVGGPVTDHGIILDLSEVPWAKGQLWAPDAAERNGKYFLYFPAKDRDGVFRIGAASSTRPEGPFRAESTPIRGTFSIDPAVFLDSDGAHYLYFGGIWGGQLQRWKSGSYRATDEAQPRPSDPALTPKVARLSPAMLELDEPVRDVLIVDEQGTPLTSGDTKRRFFEASFVHKYDGTYYFSYSTGDTHLIAYATSTSPYGPFTYRGTLLEPVLGWTNHHSIVEFQGKWYLFYHDCELSHGQTHLRNVKVMELHHEADGSIRPMSAFKR